MKFPSYICGQPEDRDKMCILSTQGKWDINKTVENVMRDLIKEKIEIDYKKKIILWFDKIISEGVDLKLELEILEITSNLEEKACKMMEEKNISEKEQK